MRVVLGLVALASMTEWSVVMGFVTPSVISRTRHHSIRQAVLVVRSSTHGAENESLHSSSSSSSSSRKKTVWDSMASAISQTAAARSSAPHAEITSEQDKLRVQLITLLRVGIPSVLTGVVAFLTFPGLAIFLATIMNDPGVFAVLSQDSSQFVQNFLTVSGLLFSILAGQTYYFMYQQQEALYYALFDEVTEAKSLLEQVALVCQGRAMYSQVLKSISQYVQNDLKQLQDEPAVLLSARPVDDPLESIMYMTSVGVPSSVYETVRSLRQARARRLGALQRKLPQVHMLLLWLLAAIELVSFPLLGAGTQTIGGYNILTVEGCLFGIMTSGIVMTMRVVGELWRPAGGAYNVDNVLSIMVRGLEEELKARMTGGKVYAAGVKSPSPQFVPPKSSPSDDTQNRAPPPRTLPVMQSSDDTQNRAPPRTLPVMRQGPSIGDIFGALRKVVRRAMGR